MIIPQHATEPAQSVNQTIPQKSWMAGLASLVIPAFFACGLVRAEESVTTPNGESADKSTAKVGAYYYPWFQENSGPEGNDWKHNVMRTLLTEKQDPRIGHYDSASPAVVKEPISQSLRGGIDFCAVSWWGPDTVTDKNFRNAI